jgi:hypothetical protein
MYDIILAPFNWLPRWVETNSKQKSYDTFPKAPWVQTGNDSISLVEMYRVGGVHAHISVGLGTLVVVSTWI